MPWDASALALTLPLALTLALTLTLPLTLTLTLALTLALTLTRPLRQGRLVVQRGRHHQEHLPVHSRGHVVVPRHSDHRGLRRPRAIDAHGQAGGLFRHAHRPANPNPNPNPNPNQVASFAMLTGLLLMAAIISIVGRYG